jgi:hypothetical protein
VSSKWIYLWLEIHCVADCLIGLMNTLLSIFAFSYSLKNLSQLLLFGINDALVVVTIALDKFYLSSTVRCALHSSWKAVSGIICYWEVQTSFSKKILSLDIAVQPQKSVMLPKCSETLFLSRAMTRWIVIINSRYRSC